MSVNFAAFDWESLIPILFLVIYGLTQLFGGNKTNQEEDKDGSGSSPAPLSEEIERVREEVRRKIAERQGKAESKSPSPTQSYPSQRSAPPPVPRSYEPYRPGTRGTPAQGSTADSRRSAPPPLPSSMEGGSQYERALEEQRRRLREAQEAKREAQKKSSGVGAPITDQIYDQISDVIAKNFWAAHGRAGASQEAAGRATLERQKRLQSWLSQPKTLRDTIVVAEILGQPTALRRENPWDR